MDKVNVAEFLRRHSQAYPQKDALIWANKNGTDFDNISFQAFEALTNAQARMLANEGIVAGDKVVFMVKPGLSMYSLIFALYKLGAIPVLVDPGMGLKRMLHCYQSVKARAFIGVPVAIMLKRLAPRYFSTIEITISVKNDTLYRNGREINVPTEATPFPIYHAAPDDILHIAFTTGSTGPAKAVECTHDMASAMKDIIIERYFYTPEDIELITIPFIGVLTLIMGNTGIMPKMDAGKPAQVNPKDIINAIDRFGASCVTASPALFNVLGQYGEQHPFVLKSLRFVSSGGAPTSFSTMKSLTNVLPDTAHFDVSWGATEALPLAAMNVRSILEHDNFKPTNGQGSCLGTAMAGVDIRIMQNIEGNVSSFDEAPFLPTNEIGEFVVSGRNVSKAYHQDEASDSVHKVTLNDQIWHRTGDLGYIDEHNKLWFCGRKSEVVYSATGNQALYTAKCEGIVNVIPEVFRSALVKAKLSSPDNQASSEGQEHAVMVVEVNPEFLSNNQTFDTRALQQRILETLKKHEATNTIEHVIFHPNFPVDIRHNAKINRKALGEFASKQLQSDSHSLGLTQANTTITPNPWMLVPILGWLYIAYGLIFPLDHIALQAIWVIDVFLSTLVHILQYPMAAKKATLLAYSKKTTWLYTILFGATWWKAL